MNRSNEYSLKEAINEFLKTYKLGEKLKENRLIHSWEKLMGNMIAQHTKDLYIQKRKLFVKLDSAVLREELSYAKEKVLKSLNDEAGDKVIEEIVFL